MTQFPHEIENYSASMVETPRVISSNTSSRTFTVSSAVKIVTLLSLIHILTVLGMSCSFRSRKIRCPFCKKALGYLEELQRQEPYSRIEIRMIDELAEPEVADRCV